MIVRTYEECRDTDRHVVTEGWESVRMLLKDDKMGFSFHITTIFPNSEHEFEYKNHFESVFCVSGGGSITDIAKGETHEIKVGTMYALDQHDRHILRGGPEGMVVACCFNPPVSGREVHDEDGAYAADVDDAA
ncbi:ectoine synthase [Nisaea sediminum]|jgi:L-ectoine synthase|uniref:ectoine synthase n=1 Tax=Nisaea sediminum TaxID=2775867 RepID=UPI001866F642|nr:ectoine synthase [Nisaea sediminum]